MSKPLLNAKMAHPFIQLEEIMQLLNKSKRHIDGHKPNDLFEVSNEEGKKLLTLYGEHEELIEIKQKPKTKASTIS